MPQSTKEPIVLTLHQIQTRLEELESAVSGEASSQYITPQEIAAFCQEVFGWTAAPSLEESEHLARLVNIHFHVSLDEDH
jgi:hypothetical protein